MSSSAHMFVGPTSIGIAPDKFAGLQLHPPVRRGVLPDLLATHRSPGTIIIVDGTFHDYPSVGHAEIVQAMRTGWQVWGLSSMGAIRAAELKGLGMRGYGEVYERFVADPGFGDDEVALLHLGEPPFTAASEPLYHLRNYLDHQVAAGTISEPVATAVLETLKQSWFGNRTLGVLFELLAGATGICASKFAADRSGFQRFRTKTHDLEAFLATTPWLAQEEQ